MASRLPPALQYSQKQRAPIAAQSNSDVAMMMGSADHHDSRSGRRYPAGWRRTYRADRNHSMVACNGMRDSGHQI